MIIWRSAPRLFDLDGSKDRIASAYQDELVTGIGAVSRHKSTSSLASLLTTPFDCLDFPAIASGRTSHPGCLGARERPVGHGTPRSGPGGHAGIRVAQLPVRQRRRLLVGLSLLVVVGSALMDVGSIARSSARFESWRAPQAPDLHSRDTAAVPLPARSRCLAAAGQTPQRPSVTR